MKSTTLHFFAVLLMLFSVTPSHSQSMSPEDALASTVEFLNYRWQLELHNIELFKEKWLFEANSDELQSCKEQNGSFWSWLTYDKCEKHRRIMRTKLHNMFKLNQAVTRKYDIYVNNIKDPRVRNSAPVKNSKDLNFEIYHKVQTAIDSCLQRSDEIFNYEYNYKSNVEYFKSGTDAIDCYYNWIYGYSQVISGSGANP